jgi:hypothetical protein
MEKMTIREILDADLAKNYKDENATADEYYDGIKKLVETGTTLERVGNTLFICTPISKSEVEFHSCNAENKQKLMENGNIFLSKLFQNGCKKAITYYDDPRSTTLLDGFGFPYKIEKVDQGKNATYKAEVGV